MSSEDVVAGMATQSKNRSGCMWERCARNGGDGELQMLIPSTKRKQIICVRNGDKWMLPSCVSGGIPAVSSQYMINEAKQILCFDFDITVLRWIYHKYRRIKVDRHIYIITRAIIAFECHENPQDLPRGWEWVNIEEAAIDYPEEEFRRAIEQELVDMRNGTEPKSRVAWGRLGWIHETSEWMCEMLRSHGLELTGPVVQLKSTIVSTVLRASTQRGYYFLKCSPAFCNEAAITNVLCRVTPLYVEKPLMVDEERRVTISADHVVEFSLYGVKGVYHEGWDEVCRNLARFQHATSCAMEELEAASLKVYRADWMEKILDGLLEHEELAFLRRFEALEKLKGHKEFIRTVLRDGAKSKWPISFVHANLLDGNIFRRGGAEEPFCFFDWDASYGLRICQV